MPLLEEFHQRYGDRVAVLGIDYQDQQTDKAADLVAASGVTYPLATDPDGAIDGKGAFPQLRGLPFWAVVDEQGTVTHLKAGEVRSVDEIVALAEEHLGVDL
jgi:cytochrome c biogenesis protein CcmG, thiol:disulfide interchange protein DsbE